MHRLLFATLLPLALAGCGSEREFSGVWRQMPCDEGPASPDCSDFVYELHIGRYGDQLTGIVVRYVYDRSGLDSFQRPKECGCFFIEGGVAEGDEMRFRLHDATTPRYPQPDTLDSDLGCQTGQFSTTCAGRRFRLEGDDELMAGETVCGCPAGQADCEEPPGLPVAFERVVGQPRTECYERRGIEQ